MIMNFEELTDIVLDYFYLTTHKDRIDLEIEYVDDIYERRLALAYDENQKSKVTAAIDYLYEQDSLMVLPPNAGGKYRILVSTYTLDDTDFLGAIIHELTHIHDFIDFASAFSLENYDGMEAQAPFDPFYYWTEYHATRSGYQCNREIKVQLSEVPLSEEHQFTLTEIELKLQSNKLLNASDEKTVLQFLGMFSVWEDQFPEKINPAANFPEFMFKACGQRILELYRLLHSMNDFAAAKDKLTELTPLLKVFG